jgi:putative ABC transport system permease protein
MDALIQDIRYGLRILARNRGFTAVAAVTLAVGIGGTTAIFSLVNAVLLRPLPFPESDRLVFLQAGADDPQGPLTAVAQGDFVDLISQNSTFESMTAFTGATFSLTGAGEPEGLFGATVTRSFFRTLGVAAVVGRTFEDTDAGPRLAQMAVISERLWRRRFAADPEIVGKPLILNRQAFTIVGVVPREFTFPRDIYQFSGNRASPPPEVWVPFTPEPDYRSNAWHQVVGRLKPGVTRDQASADLRVVAARVATAPDRDREPLRIVPLHARIVGDVRQLLTVFLGAIGFVLLIACVNVANLLLARAAARRKEVAVRSALGSGRWRLIRQFVTESVLLGLLGGAGGILIALWGVDLLPALVPAGAVPRLQEIEFDLQALAFAIAISLASGVIFGLAPAVHAAGDDIVGSLKDGDSSEKPRLRILDALVISEVALAFVLLVGAALVVRSFVRLTSVDPGFQPEQTLTLSVTLPEGEYETTTQMAAFAGSVLDRLSKTPGVLLAGAVNWLPLGGSMLTGDFTAESGSTEGVWVAKTAVSPDYFRVMSIPLLRGRAFSAGDGASAPGVAILTEQVAQRVWPGQDAIGRRLRLGFGPPDAQPWLTVVGIVKGVRATELRDEPQPAIYVPVAQAPRPIMLRFLTFVIRPAGDALQIAAAARRAVQQVDPYLPADRVQTMESLVAGSVSEPRFRALILTSFASAALMLVGTGILGVLAYAVARRTREIGVRMALGAQPGDVFRLVVRHAFTMTAIGVTFGLAGAVALTRVLRRYLYEIEPSDPIALTAAALMLLVVAAAAIYVPARRATAVDPLIALRAE